MKKIFSGLLLSAMVLLPLTASAQESTASLEAQAQTLLQEVQQLEAQIAAQGGTVSGTTGEPVTTTTVNASTCPNIGRSLSYGSTGTDVSNLQTFLAADPTVYPEGLVTGYFGDLTQTAVERFQTKYNIVSSGNPQTTGYGVVGPRTAAVIALVCSQQSSSTTTTTGTSPVPTVGGYIQVSPISGDAPLAVSVSATINTVDACAGATYVLNFGDGSESQQMIVEPNNCSQETQTFTHTYTTAGTYQIVLASGTHQTTASVTVYGTTATTPTQQDSLGASVTSGQAPLSVTFIGNVSGNDAAACTTSCDDTIEFGDGTTGLIPLPSGAGSLQSFSIAHVYTASGNYTIQLVNPQSVVVAQSVAITVAGTATQTPTTPTTPSTPSTPTYAIVSITPGVGGNPLSVTAQLSVPCSTYSVDWGDGTIAPNSGTSGACTGGTASSPTVSHSYAQSGTYTIKLEDGAGTVQATSAISISN